MFIVQGFFLAFSGLEIISFSTKTRSLVGAGLLAMVVNDNAYNPDKTRRTGVHRRQAGSYRYCGVSRNVNARLT
jgi:hypothetical protein